MIAFHIDTFQIQTRKLQQYLKNLQTWEKDCQMEVHPKKVPSFKHHKQEETHQIHVYHPRPYSRDSQVCKIPRCKHPMPTKLEYTCYQNLKQSKLNALYPTKKSPKTPSSHKEFAYKSMIRPILEYSSTGPKHRRGN